MKLQTEQHNISPQKIIENTADSYNSLYYFIYFQCRVYIKYIWYFLKLKIRTYILYINNETVSIAKKHFLNSFDNLFMLTYSNHLEKQTYSA